MDHFVDYFGLGINLYPEWGPSAAPVTLDYAASDCLKVVSTLTSVGVRTRSWIAADSTQGARPVRNEIYRGVQAFLNESRRDKPKMFYFAGHGVSINGGLHICASDFDERIAEKCAIDVSEIVFQFCSSSPWSLFIFDCCRAPLKIKASAPAAGAFGVAGIRMLDNSIVIASCSQGEFAYEAASIDGKVSGGIFTHFLCKSIVDSFRKRPVIRASVADIFNRARNDTTSFVLDRAGRSQTPRMIGAQGSDYFLTRQ